MPRIERSHNAVLVVYHSINEYCEDRIRVPNIVTPTAFEAQMQYLVSTAKVIPLQEYVDHVEERKPILNKSIVVTFDDGYKDNLTVASPILQKYGVPATFFIATRYIGADKMKWEDQVSCLIRRSEAESISLSLPSNDVSFKIGSDKDKFRVIDTLVNILGHLKQTERLQVLDELSEQAKVKCDDQANVIMTWDDVRQLADTPGFSIGSHTVTHQHLTRIPLDDVVFEVTSSKEHLESEIKRPVTLFSYPYGDFNQGVITAVRSAGYTSAGTIEYGRNSIRSDPFRLKRVLIPNQSGAKFAEGLRLRTSIFGEFLRKSYNMFNSLNRNALTKRELM